MSKNCRLKFVKSVVYFVILSNIVGGLTSVITRGIVPLCGLFLMLGLLAIAGGLVLLVGVLRDNDRFILVYLILAIMVISFTTVLISVLIIPKAKELQVHVFVIVYVVLILCWPALYCVYLYYKGLLKSKLVTQIVVVEEGSSEKTENIDKNETLMMVEGTSRACSV